MGKANQQSLEPPTEDGTPVIVMLPKYVEPAVFEVVDPYSKNECLLVTGWIRGRRPIPLGLDLAALADLTARKMT